MGENNSESRGRKEWYAKFNEIQASVHDEQPIIPACYYGCAATEKDSVKVLSLIGQGTVSS